MNLLQPDSLYDWCGWHFTQAFEDIKPALRATFGEGMKALRTIERLNEYYRREADKYHKALDEICSLRQENAQLRIERHILLAKIAGQEEAEQMKKVLVL